MAGVRIGVTWSRLAVLAVGVTCACRVGSDASPTDGTVTGDGAGMESDALRDPSDDVAPPLWAELIEPVIHVGGGDALGPDDDDLFFPYALGADGGHVRVRSRGALSIDGALTDPAAPAEIPIAPGGIELTSADLGGDVTRSETVRVRTTVVASGADVARIITSTDGDIVIEGHLLGGVLDAGRQSLSLRAPHGTVYVSGSIETGAVAGARAGRNAGALEIRARSVVIAGALLSAGEPGANAGGDGGAIDVIAADGPVVFLAGSIVSAGGDGGVHGGDGGAIEVRGQDVWLVQRLDSRGGDVRGIADAAGGTGGDIALRASDSLYLGAPARLRGGAATTIGTSATGGAAGTLSLDAGAAVRVRAAIDARGGFARAAWGGAVTGGAAGAFLLGDNAPPRLVELRVPIELTGGRGFVSAGDGGDVELQAVDGDLLLGTTLHLDGGSSARHPGDAGAVSAIAGPSGGGILLSGPIIGHGGSASPGNRAAGGTGARVVLDVRARDGDLVVSSAGSLVLDGGAAAGNAVAGGGGDITLLTLDGNATMAGRLIARGGVAPDPGGTGGRGGIVDVFTDGNFNGVGGDLLIDTTGSIDVSGGAGTRGGSARNNAGAGVASFPVHQDQLAVLLNSDGVHGGPRDGDLVNLGHIIARGGAADGSGGDVMFHGRQPHSTEDPLPGDLSLEGDGDGHSGQFAAE